MDEAPNGDMNMNNHGTQGLLSTMPLDNEFNFDVNLDVSKLFDLLEEQPINTNIISRTSIENAAPNHQNPDISEFPNDTIRKEQSMITNVIPNSSSTEKGDKNCSSRKTCQITLDEDDDYSLYYIYVMGVKMLQEKGGTCKISTNDEKGQENSKINDLIPMRTFMEKEGDIHISSRKEQDNPRTNVMMLQQPISKVSVLENLEKEPVKSKFTIDHPLKISTITRKEQENPKVNDLTLDPLIPKIPYLEKLKRDTEKPKFTVDHTKREQENSKNNVIILDPPTPESPILMEKESNFMKSKHNIDHSVGISTSKTGEKENPMINNMILQKYMSNISTLEKLKSNFMKPKLIIDNPFETSTSRREEQKKPKTGGLIFQQPMSNIPTLEKLKSNFMKPKLMPGHSFGTPTRRREENYKREIGNGVFKSASSSNKEDEIHYDILTSSDDDQFSQKMSFNGGPIRRSPNKTSSRYQPFERQTPNKQGSDRFLQSNSESTFHKLPQAREESIIRDAGTQWKNQLEEIKRKTGIDRDSASSSYHRRKILNYLQRKSHSSHVAENEKQNFNNEEALVVERSLIPIIHSNRNFQGSPANTHEITDKFKSVAGGRNTDQETQGYGYANQVITLGKRNDKINEEGAHDQLEPSGVQSFNAEDTYFNRS